MNSLLKLKRLTEGQQKSKIITIDKSDKKDALGFIKMLNSFSVYVMDWQESAVQKTIEVIEELYKTYRVKAIVVLENYDRTKNNF